MANADKGRKMIDAEMQKKPVLYSPLEALKKVDKLHRDGMPSGDQTGWPSLDKHYTVFPGLITIVTGWPSSGKSEFIDALVINLAEMSGWKFAMFSFENQPISYHIIKMIEKMSGKPFGPGYLDRIVNDELTELVDRLSQSFSFCSRASGNFSLKDVLDASQEYLKNFPESKRGVVIDPWNELEHNRPERLSETEYISKQLSMVRNWARLNNVHVWITAHPQKVVREKGKLPVPRPDMISGSQHWWNKSDCAICIDRAHSQGDKQKEVDIHIQKIRFKHIGKIGSIVLHYDRDTGEYIDPEAPDKDFDQ